MAHKVIILGGGIGGLSAAQELVERGFDVEVFERQAIPGGKARSIRVVEPFATGERPLGGKAFLGPRYRSQRPWVPGEHGFRFFPGFYRHVVDTMSRIPYSGGSVADNLVDTTEVHVARFGKPGLKLPARFPRTPADLRNALFALIDWLGGHTGVDPQETSFFAWKVWQIATSSGERRLEEYEKIDWWAFIDAERRSVAYQNTFGQAITRSLVAAKARRASAKTIGDIFVQILFDILDPTVSTADRLLNGPTNQVWIDPWFEYLMDRGVRYHLETKVCAIHMSSDRVRSVMVERAGRRWVVEADYFVSALPVERMAELVTPAMCAVDPLLSGLPELSRNVEWMNGIQFYLTSDVPIAHGHTIHMDTPWALTSVSQAQFWPDFDMSEFGDGRVRGVLSVDISDFNVPGLNRKKAVDCTREEIAEETWSQLKRSLNVEGRELLRDDQLHAWFLDPDIFDADPGRPGIEVNREPLLVNYVDTWRLRPEADTEIENFFLASDYVRTHTDLATMEAANEAARRAVNGLLEVAGSEAVRCEIWPLHEPPVFAPFRAYDQMRFRQGLPWDASSLELAESARVLAQRLAVYPEATELPRMDEQLLQRLRRDLGALAKLDEPPSSAPGEHTGLGTGTGNQPTTAPSPALRPSATGGKGLTHVVRRGRIVPL